MDKIEQIKAEIESRYAEYRAKMKTDDFTYYEGMADALDLFEQFIDSLPSEPSEDLEKAAGEYIAPWLDIAYEKYGLPRQKSLSKYAYDMEEAFEAGAQWQKEQMLRGAVEGVVQYDGQFINFGDGRYIDLEPTIGRGPVFELTNGDKVKLVIIKED